MSAIVVGSSVRTCFGDEHATFSALLRGESGVADIRGYDGPKLNVTRAYQIDDATVDQPFRAGEWLGTCVAEAMAQARVDPTRRRVMAMVGTGLRELREVEKWAIRPTAFPLERLHFKSVVQEACPHVGQVVTISNACSAGGHALALAQDLLELGDVDAVVVGATDTMTASMVGMIGCVSDAPTEEVRPFDAERTGVLLGEGAVALVLQREGSETPAIARVLGTGLSCDAYHETAPSAQGIARAMEDALRRSGVLPSEIDLVLAHGTGTALNDPIEAEVVRRLLAPSGPGPLVTAIKGAVGHTSGGAALLSVAVAMRCLQDGVVPPIVGLRRALGEGDSLRLVKGRSVETELRVAQVNAFGFGGVNAVTILEKVA